MKTVHSVLAALYVTLSTAPLSASELTVEMVGLENREGALLYAVYNEARAFPADVERAVISGRVDLSEGEDVALKIPLEPGHYAIALVHDQNSNGKLDLGAFDIPVEGFGFSNNPDASGGVPSFKDCTFEFTKAAHSIQVTIKY